MLIADGAYGTVLQPHLQHGELADELCRRAPARVVEQHLAYIEAGAQAIQTNSFMAWALPSARARVVYEAAVACALEAAQGRPVTVRGTIGPAGTTPRSFYRQIEFLLERELPVVVCETVTEAETASAFLRAWHEVARGAPATAIVSLSIDPLGAADRLGWIQRLQIAGPVELGLNCCNGPQPELRGPLEALLEYEVPVHLSPSAGLPSCGPDGAPQYAMSAGRWAEAVASLSEGLPLASVGGCCGTTPEMIGLLAETAAGAAAG